VVFKNFFNFFFIYYRGLFYSFSSQSAGRTRLQSGLSSPGIIGRSKNLKPGPKKLDRRQAKRLAAGLNAAVYLRLLVNNFII
jgi:hypothetical protein